MLVSLLIAQSILDEAKEPVIYLCQTVQRAEQPLAKIQEYGIPELPYVEGDHFREFFGVLGSQDKE